MNIGYKIEDQKLIVLETHTKEAKLKGLYPALKRAADIVLALTTLIVLGPLMLLTALMVVIESSG